MTDEPILLTKAMICAADAERITGLDRRTITRYASNGLIAGAVQYADGGKWFMPLDVVLKLGKRRGKKWRSTGVERYIGLGSSSEGRKSASRLIREIKQQRRNTKQNYGSSTAGLRVVTPHG